MSIKRILAAAAASVVAVSAMAVVASADGSMTVSDSNGWTEYTVFADGAPDALIGDVDPDTIASITFSSDVEFKIGYNGVNGDHWYDKDAAKEFVLDDMLLTEEGALKFAVLANDGVEYTISWTLNLKDGAAAPDESTPEESTPEESTPEESTPEESKTDENTGANNVDTGVEGVAAVLGVAAVAAGAMIVAKKRK